MATMVLRYIYIQFSVDIFDGSKIIFIQLGFCTYIEQWRDAVFPNYFYALEVSGAMVPNIFPHPNLLRGTHSIYSIGMSDLVTNQQL